MLVLRTATGTSVQIPGRADRCWRANVLGNPKGMSKLRSTWLPESTGGSICIRAVVATRVTLLER